MLVQKSSNLLWTPTSIKVEILIAAGTAGFVNTHFGEALFFNPFLATYGLRLTGDNNKLKGTHNLNNDHFLFEGVSKLYFQYGNPIHILDSKEGKTQGLQPNKGHFRFAIFDGNLR